MIDKRFLVDSVTIQKPAGKDDWGKEIYSDPVKLAPCRFDRAYSGPGAVNNPAGKQNPSFMEPGLIFVYTKYCKVELDDSYRGGIVDDGNNKYIVTKILPIYHPLKAQVVCYEVEVM